jgi:hypothetical protein
MIAVVMVRSFAESQPAPGDAAVIVAIPCVLTFLALRLLSALVSRTNEPVQSKDEEKPPRAFIAIVAVFAVSVPAILIIYASALSYGHFGLVEAKSGAFIVGRWMFRAFVTATTLIALEGVYSHWGATIKRIYAVILETPVRHFEEARLRLRRAW